MPRPAVPPSPRASSRLPLLAALVAGAALAAPHAAAAQESVRTITVTARDYAFDAPDTVVAGQTAVRLVNQGTELHHVFLMRLDAGKTAADLLAAMQHGGPPPAWAHDAGGPNAPAPTAASIAVVNLVPGQYVMLCVIPSPDGKPHVMKGMVRPITVTSARNVVPVANGGTAMTKLPAVDVQMTLEDYAFRTSRPLTAGKHRVRVTNRAAQSHEVFIARLAPGKTAQDLLAWVAKPEGPPPAMPMGGTAAMGKGVSNDILLDLAPGEYGLYCFVPDAKDGKEHIAHGMIQQITVR
jgi:uncharacterized cupredoxin-like copper-binding protein